MDDTLFFREQAERFRSQAGTSADPLVKNTLESLSSGLAAYADGLEERVVETRIADIESEPRPITEDEMSIVPADQHILSGDGWLAQGHEEDEDKSESWPVTKPYLFLAMLLTPSLGVMAWTIVKHGAW
jgi:hypothetical protein